MSLQPAPHPPSVFRYLKQAWREYLVSGTAGIITITTPATQAAANPLIVSGTFTLDASVPLPPQLGCNLFSNSVFRSQQISYPNARTGAWTVTFPGGASPASVTAQIAVYLYTGPGGPVMCQAVTPNFTLT